MEFACRFRFIAILTCVICISYSESNPLENLFLKFIKEYDKYYQNVTTEYQKRFEIFQMNMAKSKYLNSQRSDNSSAWYGVTKFSDLTPDEFADMYLSGVTMPSVHIGYGKPVPDDYNLQSGANEPVENGTDELLGDLPKHVDWRTRGIITPVKNQATCGGCWAFSTVEGLESQYANLTGKQQVFSIQQLMDCSINFMSRLHGCQGGDHCTALFWMYQNNITLVTDSKYPLKNKNEKCKTVPRDAAGIKVEKYSCINATDNEVKLLRRLASYGPVAVAVDATNWHNYLGGVIQHNCPSHVNHAVQIVGYDLTGDVPYYIVRNSWGTNWGIKGYLHLRYNINACGVARIVSWADNIRIV